MNFDFRDWRVVVTGGTRGIGRAVSEVFLDSGAKVTASYRSNDRAAAEFREARSGNALETVRCDLSKPGSAEEFFREYDRVDGDLKVLVNNAGIRRDSIVGTMSEDDWKDVLETNLSGTFRMSKAALVRMMSAKFGRIISITSPSGKTGFPGQANYAASKAGQVAFAKSLAREAARKNITVNCVSPGFIDTELISDLPEELRKEYRSQVPVRRFGKTSEVAYAVAFLASEEASYITGTTLEVTGGL